MSFGYAVGDFLAVGQLCWKVYKKCKDSPGNYAELSSEIGALHNVMKETEEMLSQQGLTKEQQVKLTTCRQGCEDVLKDLDGLLVKYESLGTSSRRTFDRMGFGMQDMTGIRLRLISNVTMLDAFNNTSSHARLENKLNLLIAEVRAGKREGSVISTQTFDTAARNDQETWEALRRELEDIGISPSVITEKRQFIVAWFQEAVAAGKLDEDAPSDDNGSAVSSHASEDPVEEDDGDVDLTREISSLMIDPHTTGQNRIRESVPSAKLLSRQPADASYSRPLQVERKSRLRVTYLLNKLRSKESQFHKAARAGDVLTMEELLEKEVDINARDSSQRTALHLAVRSGQAEAVRLLLLKGAYVHTKDISSETALDIAVDFNKEQMVQLLLEHGADVESKGYDGDTVFIRAARAGYLPIVRLLLEKGADIESKGSDGDTGLIRAARAGYLPIVRLLLEKGADIESKGSDGDTGLIRAARAGYLPIVRLLLEKGADIESKNFIGSTTLLHAACNGDEPVVRLLLEKGADIESKNSDGSTALLLAAWYGHEPVVRLLLEKGADIESKNSMGSTALLHAARAGYLPVVRLLLEKGADIESKNLRGSTALINAAWNGHVPVVRLLLEKGADVNTKNVQGTTALSFAERYKHKTIVQLLRNEGAQN